MCGIFAYTGKNGKDAGGVLLDGLLSLEYRGYDSAGIYTPESGSIKTPGAVAELRKKMPASFTGKSGIAHLRWATHGEPTEKNAHPHASGDGEIWVVHNGIIENFKELKAKLVVQGHTFLSDSDTEVLPHLVEEHLKKTKDFEKAALMALNEVRGTYGIALQYKGEPDKIIAARMGSPIVLGLGDGEHFIASDPSPILPHTKKVVFLEDGEVAIITPDGHSITKLDATKVNRIATEIDWNAEEAQKGGYEHFMLKEIMEGPDVIENTLRGRLIAEKGMVKLGGLESVATELAQIERIIIVACGSAHIAGLIGEYMLEEFAGIPVEVEHASEFRYRSPVLNQRTALIAISQSGETLDTLEAVREGKRRGALTLGIVNAVGSTIARETDAGVYNHAGPEVSVASTKALISELAALVLLTIFLGRQRLPGQGGMSEKTAKEIALALKELPNKVQHILDTKQKIEKIAKKYAGVRDFIFIGRKYNYPVAFEGALKLKEISYIHAEGYGAGEMKHGPIAMIDEHFPTFAIVPQDSVYEKNVSNIHEIKARKGPVIALATEGDTEIGKLVNDVLFVPSTLEMLAPILNIVPLQLFAYYFAKEKGLNVDRPRNLAKSVTVE
ncbi:glutamine--fructose-6-phosphate aminotransferase [Candidatus Kaiserbacteria bacterium RIFCSPHIGHO2_01_FULL_54_36]|uniref:Glutamine--fructose-6-phosphate aminotransferase [isomerizing] n=1 Tax=Candidatus Kaiserbacteria bacterium RIFCSPHIGHO2_01_FULL_54_36 TaxID=1798482 RepID=A0A1F6CKX9_9BACT|nr:MAG: glutamine--fructose-6-phosphate aminotransferase [Candidatus Kaiserbacteria bacterium RIFCSPHIGHO2_01_FULL_54_36]OGG75394.1 MAG: glutamine--fructose-6-phosphate aminotransferase [Candidatus Kaiserbacteria bacterium RIFCSPLOWO2_01_FULL_54_22]